MPELHDHMVVDVLRELEAAENLLDSLADNADLRESFAESPATVFQERGLLDASEAERHEINRIFFAIVANRELVAWVRENEPTIPQPREVDAAMQTWARGEAPLSLPDEYKRDSVQEVLNHEQFFHDFMDRLAADPAVRRALPSGVGADELHEWVNASMDRIREGTPLSELPHLLPVEGGGDTNLPPIFVFVLVIVVAVVVISIAVDAHDGMIASPEDRDFERVRNLWDLSERLARGGQE